MECSWTVMKLRYDVHGGSTCGKLGTCCVITLPTSEAGHQTCALKEVVPLSDRVQNLKRVLMKWKKRKEKKKNKPLAVGVCYFTNSMGSRMVPGAPWEESSRTMRHVNTFLLSNGLSSKLAWFVALMLTLVSQMLTNLCCCLFSGYRNWQFPPNLKKMFNEVCSLSHKRSELVSSLCTCFLDNLCLSFIANWKVGLYRKVWGYDLSKFL